ncbi:MAG: thiol peroxidase [Polyangiaceae bacterium]|nr:thiol peroxidase [Polyangiaceae bacterium]
MPETRKGAINWKGNPVDLIGPGLKAGDKAPTDWTAVGNDMSAVSAKDLAGQKRIVLTVPSLDTAVCDTETRRFNQEATSVPGVKIWVISADLPFAQKRWCGAAGVSNVVTLSDYKDRAFGPAWGTFAPAKGLHARAVFVIGADDVIRHVEYVADATTEPDYAAALQAAKAL